MAIPKRCYQLARRHIRAREKTFKLVDVDLRTVPTKRAIFAQFITMREKQILAMAIGIQKKKKIGGNNAFFRDY